MSLRQKNPDAKIRYLVNQQGGEFVIELPACWKVTFGDVNPGKGAFNGHELHCLRVWEGEKCRGLFCDVRSFRDLSIPMARKVQSETRSSAWTQDSEGNFSGTTERQISDPEWRFDSEGTIAFDGEAVPF